MSDDRRFELPDDLTPDEERAIIRALERYFAQESPTRTPGSWPAGSTRPVSGGCRPGTTPTPLAPRRLHSFARRGVPNQAGRGDAG